MTSNELEKELEKLSSVDGTLKPPEYPLLAPRSVCEFCNQSVGQVPNYMKGANEEGAHIECLRESLRRLRNYLKFLEKYI